MKKEVRSRKTCLSMETKKERDWKILKKKKVFRSIIIATVIIRIYEISSRMSGWNL